MIPRISFLIASLTFGALSGGFGGFLAMFIFASIFIHWVPVTGLSQRTGGSQSLAQREARSEYVQARRGVRIDPTRPRD
jgi:hypothetical protein